MSYLSNAKLLLYTVEAERHDDMDITLYTFVKSTLAEARFLHHRYQSPQSCTSTEVLVRICLSLFVSYLRVSCMEDHSWDLVRLRAEMQELNRRGLNLKIVRSAFADGGVSEKRLDKLFIQVSISGITDRRRLRTTHRLRRCSFA